MDAYKTARKYHFISDLVGGTKKYEENLVKIRSLEMQLENLTEVAEKGHSEANIEKNKQKASLVTKKTSRRNRNTK